MREHFLFGWICLIPMLALVVACEDTNYNSANRIIECDLPGEIACGNACVAPMIDPAHCGASADCEGDNAGIDCGDLTCVDGACVAECTRPGEIACGEVCINPQLDPVHCGATDDCRGDNAGRDCGDQVCVNGTCGVQCTQGRIECAGVCVNPNEDPRHCGASGACTDNEAGTACAEGQVCSEGVCIMDCPENSLLCDGGCVDPLTTDSHCGATGDCEGPNAGLTCLAPAACIQGECLCTDMQLQCGNQCIDSNTDPRFCGARGDCLGASAGEACIADEVCEAGVCVCPNRGLRCGDACVDPQSNPLHCGMCDQPCGDQACLEGTCTTLDFVGALNVTGGVWNFLNSSGFDAAVSACDQDFPGSTVCTTEMLGALSETGQMTMAVSLDGEPVESFWAPEPGACDAWNHGSGTNGNDIAPIRSLDRDTGRVSEQQTGTCGSAHNIGCCSLE